MCSSKEGAIRANECPGANCNEARVQERAIEVYVNSFAESRTVIEHCGMPTCFGGLASDVFRSRP